MMLRPIKIKEQYKESLAQAYNLMQLNLIPESKESDKMEILSMFIKEYEQELYPVPKPKPLEAIKFRIEQKNMSEADLS